jgi:serine/threonine-protein kinase
MGCVAAGFALATLTACSGGSGGPLQPLGRAFAENAKTSAVVYVSKESDNAIEVFRLDGKRLRTITTGVNYPQGMYVDAQGTLYVANRGSSDVLEFQRGAASPFKRLTDGKNQPEDVTVCPNGNVYVANILGSGGGSANIAVYAHRSRHPTGALTYAGGFFFFLACDARGNLFASIVLGTIGTVLAFPHAHQKGAAMLPIFFGGNPYGIAADAAGNLLVANEGGGVEEFTESGQPTGLRLTSGQFDQIALGSDGTLLLGATAKGATAYTFPGGVLDHTYRTGGGPQSAWRSTRERTREPHN